ncbi:MFS general substrate transporter [Phellopilus nigrolimitatus]|nr:MFS general substrate transporter [Phellopilus nigrolimitatus]
MNTRQLAAGTLCVSFSSSSYSGGLSFTTEDLHIPREVAVLGVSLYVLGFGIGPLVFAPLSEMYGRRLIFMCTYAPYTLLHMGGALSKNVTTLLVCRLLAGISGSSPLTNAGGAISDMWVARERGLAVALYSTAPFLGPVIGPIVGGFVSEDPRLGWRFNFWIMMMFSGVVLILGVLFLPETYAPVLLRRRARLLRRQSQGKVGYISKFDLTRSRSLWNVLKVNMSRPFLFLLTEPIVTLLAVYIAIAYAILYALFAAFPIVFEEHRHFSPGQGGLAFLGIGLGMIVGTALTPLQNRFYWKAMEKSPTGKAAPEDRLYSAMVGAVMLPVGLFWFAWTSDSPVSFFAPVFAGVPFGTGISTILQSLTSYLMDSYSIYAASAIAATVVLRSIMACAFPLFSPFMFARLGDHWAMSVFAFLSLGCMPMPLLFWKYGKSVRAKSKFAVKDEERVPTPINVTLKPAVPEKKAIRGAQEMC